MRWPLIGDALGVKPFGVSMVIFWVQSEGFKVGGVGLHELARCRLVRRGR